MLKNNGGNKDANKQKHIPAKIRFTSLATATIMGVFLVGGMLTTILSLSSFLTATMLQPAYAASDPEVKVGDGEGTILYRAHRMQDSRWDSCFATQCDAGTGPGVSMFFIAYDSAFRLVGSGQADETGTYINGLVVGETYYLSPENCNGCHEDPHNVEFDHWAHDGSTVRQRAIEIASSTIINADACYAFVLDGVRSTGSCMAGNTSQPPAGNPTTASGGSPNPPSSGSDDNTPNEQQSNGEMNVFVHRQMVAHIRETFGSSSTVIAEDGTDRTISGFDIPSTNLSGQPIQGDSSLVYAEYSTLYEVISVDPFGSSQIIRAAEDAGIEWNSLSEAQKSYLILTILTTPAESMEIPDSPNSEFLQLVEKIKTLFGTETTNVADGTSETYFDIPSTNLSGQPIGSDTSQTYMHYNYVSEVTGSDMLGSARIILAATAAGIEWDSLSEAQQAHLILKVQTS